MSLLRALVVMLCVSSLVGCDKPAPTLATMVEPVVTAQRLKGGALQAILTWDTDSTACGTLQGFKVTLDDQPINASAGLYNPDAKDENLKCTFPGFLLLPDSKKTPRTLVFSDDSSTFTITVDTLEVGNALPQSPPATLKPGENVRWLTTLPLQNAKSWKATFTPMGAGELVWDGGTQLPENLTVTVPTYREPAQGEVGLTWTINSQVTRCEGPTTCDVTIEGHGGFNAVIQP